MHVTLSRSQAFKLSSFVRVLIKVLITLLLNLYCHLLSRALAFIVDRFYRKVNTNFTLNRKTMVGLRLNM